MAAPDLTQRSTVFVNKVGTDDAGYNIVGAPEPRLTIAAALADLAANYPAASLTNPHTIAIGPGDFTTPAFALPPFTFIQGSADGESGNTTRINLTGNVTLGSGWSVNATKNGGFQNLTFRVGSGTPLLDFTMPAPAAGNPSRTLELENITTDVDRIDWEATSTADKLNVNRLIHDGTNANDVELSGGTIFVQNCRSGAIFTVNDTATIACTAQVYALFITDAASALKCISTGVTTTVRCGACDNQNLTLSETAPGVITVYADAVSIPLAANITYGGTATTADLIRTTDGGGIAPGSTGNSYTAVANNAGNTTITPTGRNNFVALTVGGVARTSVIIAAIPATATAGDLIDIDCVFPATAAIILEFRNATAGGTLLEQFTTDGVTLAGTVQLVYTGAAWILWQAVFGP